MVHFEWDDGKNRENQHKHGVSFEEAQRAFADVKRVVAEDLEHSRKENGFTALGASARES